MEIEIDSKRNNPLLNRTEVYFTVKHKGESTPNRELIRSELADKLNAKKENIIVNIINPEFGSQETSGYAKVYSSLEKSKAVEREYILKRNKAIEGGKPKKESETPAEAKAEPAVEPEKVEQQPEQPAEPSHDQPTEEAPPQEDVPAEQPTDAPAEQEPPKEEQPLEIEAPVEEPTVEENPTEPQEKPTEEPLQESEPEQKAEETEKKEKSTEESKD